MSEPHDRDGDPGAGDSPDGIVTGALIGGIVSGFAVSFVWMFLSGLALYVTFGDPATTGQEVVGTLLVLTPLVVAVVLLLVPRLRRTGAGFAMGMAIGSIVLTGVCLGPGLLG